MLSRMWLSALVLVLASTIGPAAAGHAEPPGAPSTSTPWAWPVWPAIVDAPYVQPAHRYGAGHRGIDVRPLSEGARVRAPADGVVAFVGQVAGRPLVTIDHGSGLVTTLEPVESELAPGAALRRGEDVGVLGVGGHTASGALHFGVRLHGEYINPLLLIGEVPRAILLPCCD